MCDPIGLGPLHLHVSQIPLMLGFVCAAMLSFHRMVQAGVSAGTARLAQLAVLVGGVLVGRSFALVFRLLNNPDASTQPTSDWGISILGAVFGGGLFAWWCLARQSDEPGVVLDLAIVPAPLGIASARVGCLLAGCCSGRPTDSPLGLNLSDLAGVWATRYPTQIISVAANLLIFAALIVAERLGSRHNRLAPGSVAWIFVGLFCFKRLLIDPLRSDSTVVWGLLSAPQVFSAAGVAIAVAALVLLNRTTGDRA